MYMHDPDIIFKYKTPLEGGLLAKLVHGVVSEGWAENPIITSNERSVSLTNISFYYSGRDLGDDDIDAKSRMFHISFNGTLTFDLPDPFSNDPALAIGFCYRFRKDYPAISLSNHFETNLNYFHVIRPSIINGHGSLFPDGFDGLILCRLKYDTDLDVWRATIDGTSWSEKLFRTKCVPYSPRLAPMNIDNRCNFDNKRFYLKCFNEVVPFINVLVSSTSNEVRLVRLNTADGLSIDTPASNRRFFAIGYQSTNVDFSFLSISSGTLVLTPGLQVLNPDGDATLAVAIRSTVQLVDGVNTYFILVGVVEWDDFECVIHHFNLGSAIPSVTTLSDSYFGRDDHGNFIIPTALQEAVHGFTDRSTPAVEQASVQNVLQTIWDKIRSFANVIPAAAGAANILADRNWASSRGHVHDGTNGSSLVSWGNLTNRNHDHSANNGGFLSMNNISGLVAQLNALDSALGGKSDVNHTHANTFTFSHSFNSGTHSLSVGSARIIRFSSGSVTLSGFTVGFYLKQDSVISFSGYNISIHSAIGTSSVSGADSTVLYTTVTVFFYRYA